MDLSGVRLLSPLEVPDWDERLAHLPGATFFHGAAWARVLHDAYGFRPTYFVREASGRFESVLPVMDVRSWLTGRRGVGLPFTDECAPLCPAGDEFHALWAAARTQAGKCGWKYLELRGGREWFGAIPASTSFFGHRLDLRTGEPALFARMEGSVRRAVRKAEQSGLNVEFSQNLESVRAFYDLLCLTRRRHGVPPQPFHFFACIHRHVLAPGRGWVVLARQGGVPVAGAVFFHFGQSVLYKFGASDATRSELRANNLVMWRAIAQYAGEGFAALDFGRTSLGNEGLRRFKLGWGSSEHRIDYVRYRTGTDSFVLAADQASGRVSRLFRQTPVFLSRLIGALLYRHMA